MYGSMFEFRFHDCFFFVFILYFTGFCTSCVSLNGWEVGGVPQPFSFLLSDMGISAIFTRVLVSDGAAVE